MEESGKAFKLQRKYVDDMNSTNSNFFDLTLSWHSIAGVSRRLVVTPHVDATWTAFVVALVYSLNGYVAGESTDVPGPEVRPTDV